MDCEKCEPLLLDELYDELDEVTSAAVKRHVSGCARCAAILNGMRSTRRLAVLPVLDLPSGLEDRILASVKEAQKVVPIQSRLSRAVSLAGSWAMRPQTAMAAVFLLMIGTSAFVIRSRHSSERAAAVSVTEEGIPAGQLPSSDDHDSLDNKAAAAAHGPNAPQPVTAPPVAAASAAGALALNGDQKQAAAGALDGLTGGKGRVSKEEEGSIGSALAGAKADKSKDETPAGAEKKTTTRSGNGPAADIANAAAPAGAPADDYAPRGQAVAAPAAKSGQDPQPQDGFSAGMAAYRARSYAEATRQFDAAARSGDQNAALWAAKSVKDGNGGCGAALPRFEAVTQRSGGTWIGNEAQLEAARCLSTQGQLDAARDKLTRLSGTATHAQAAAQALAELNQVASRREAERSKRAAGAGAGGGLARPAPAPVRATAKPSTAVDGVDKANGF